MGLLDKDKTTIGWGGYPLSAWDKPSFAVVANRECGTGCVLFTGGPAVPCDMDQLGGHLADLGLDNAPPGVSVWEGTVRCWRDRESGADDSELVGTFRPPNDAEWDAIRRGVSPWDEADWGCAGTAEGSEAGGE